GSPHRTTPLQGSQGQQEPAPVDSGGGPRRSGGLGGYAVRLGGSRLCPPAAELRTQGERHVRVGAGAGSRCTRRRSLRVSGGIRRAGGGARTLSGRGAPVA